MRHSLVPVVALVDSFCQTCLAEKTDASVLCISQRKRVFENVFSLYALNIKVLIECVNSAEGIFPHVQPHATIERLAWSKGLCSLLSRPFFAHMWPKVTASCFDVTEQSNFPDIFGCFRSRLSCLFAVCVLCLRCGFAHSWSC